jgi:pyridoxal phosphate enzyme (YggS family)
MRKMLETVSLVFMAISNTLVNAKSRCNMNKQLERLKSLQLRIEQACKAVGRRPDEVALLAVSKRHPVEKIIALNELGVCSFGENQLQEALQKQQELLSLSIQWHFIGAVQSNKTRAIAEHFQWVQSIGRQKTLNRLSAQRPPAMEPLNVCLQVNIDREVQKAGASPEDILQLAAHAQGLDNIRLRGLMALPRQTTVLEKQQHSFRKVKALYDELKAEGHDIDTLSIGMSHDLEAAISEGSTMVRIGTDLLGRRET